MSHLVAALMIRRKLLVKIRLYISAHRLMRGAHGINILTGIHGYITCLYVSTEVRDLLRIKVEVNKTSLKFDDVSLTVSSYVIFLVFVVA